MKCMTKWSDVRIADISMQKQRRWIRFVQENKDAEKLSRKASADGRYLRREQNMKLIDADALAKELMHEGLGYQYNRVMCAPTVDAVPVIRCKDCKHMVEHKGYGYLGESAYTCESNMDGWILPDSYCSMAERKEG